MTLASLHRASLFTVDKYADNVIDSGLYLFNMHGLRYSMAEIGCQAPTLTCIRAGKLYARLKGGEHERRYWYQVDQVMRYYTMELALTEAKKKEVANKRAAEFLEYGKLGPTTLIGTSKILGKYLVAVDGGFFLEVVDPTFSAFTPTQMINNPDPYFDSYGPFPRPTLPGIPAPTTITPLLLRENPAAELAESPPFLWASFLFCVATFFFFVWFGMMVVGFLFLMFTRLGRLLLAPLVKHSSAPAAHSTPRAAQFETLTIYYLDKVAANSGRDNNIVGAPD
ncbi:uncharacterized protein EI97DRAFT_446725 [Westerdykella ornata]|uniref:Uncharacterized protein n=1 Tax=Westerdykella ornata TaxID=318751 RepID=A0A6A6J4Z1_WESOR|nr:uncharacterized protein EI97DRAFT_446725 [Westerdykella ornata]KAF2271304.1 hypothetical protein EI97DRAFT_446725 [Westerdykella ornata]